MAVRTSMLDLIYRTRVLIADTSLTVFSDSSIQDALDFWRWELRWVALRPSPTYTTSGLYYYDFYSDSQNWESGVLLQDLSFTALTPDVSELIVGHWHFATQPNGIGVRATGKTYDIYRSAADLLGDWAATVMLDFSFKTGDELFNRDQKFKQITMLQEKYMGMALPRAVRLIQSDASDGAEGNAVTYPSSRGGFEGMGG